MPDGARQALWGLTPVQVLGRLEVTELVSNRLSEGATEAVQQRAAS